MHGEKFFSPRRLRMRFDASSSKVHLFFVRRKHLVELFQSRDLTYAQQAVPSKRIFLVPWCQVSTYRYTYRYTCTGSNSEERCCRPLYLRSDTYFFRNDAEGSRSDMSQKEKEKSTHLFNKISVVIPAGRPGELLLILVV